MSEGLYPHTTRAVGTVLTAAIYNADHQNHITNQNPSMTGAYSDNLAEHQANTDPGGLGAEILAASLAEELEQLRFCLKRITGKAQWYIAPATNLEAAFGTVTDLIASETVSFTGDITPAQITASQNDYAPTGHGDAFHFRLTSDAVWSITGLAGGSDGRIVLIENFGSFNIILENGDLASAAANRFAFPSDVILGPQRSFLLKYDAVTSRWRSLQSDITDDLRINGTLTVGNVTQSGYTDFTEISVPANPAANDARTYSRDLGGTTVLAYLNSAGLETILCPGARAYDEYVEDDEITTVIDQDDTIPQNTEGTEILSVTLTLNKASSRVRIRAEAFGAATVEGASKDDPVPWTMALFQDDVADALNAARIGGIATNTGTNSNSNGSLQFEHAPGDVGPHTYSVRVGKGTAGNVLFLNANINGTRFFGGAAKSTLIVEEIYVT